MAGVLFVVMPFGACDAPQVGVSTMQAQLKAEGVPCDIAYLNLLFAQGIGLDRYTQIGLTSGEVFAGEWLFASDLFPQQQRRQQDYVQHVLGTNNLPPAVNAAELMGVSRFITPFLDHCMAVVNWDRYAIIGFTSMFEQNLASLALARRIKERYPTKIIAMGGANCFGPMGLQLHKSFPFLDFVFTGEADLTFPTVARRLLNGQSPGDDLQGYVRRENGRSIENGPATCLKELDRLPYPDYDDFYAQFAVSQLPRDVLQYLLLETSRGCWWGQKNQCRFCGISHAEIPYRSKSPERALNEMLYLGDRYGIRHLMTVDNILGLPFFETLLPDLRRRQRNFTLFYESKANLKKEQVQMLAEAGVVSIQPGIESFADNTLGLMHKGVSALQNIQLLKWCREFGITPMWNLLYGFPRENLQDYGANLQTVQAITHLQSPMGYGPVRLERFSPMFEQPEAFGLRHIHPMKAYQYIYPFDEATLSELAYFFEFDFDGKEKAERWFIPIRQELERWKLAPAPATLQAVDQSPDHLIVHDTRPTRTQSEYQFRNPEKAVIEFCDEVRTFSKILEHVRNSVPDANKCSSAEWTAWLQGALDYLVANRLMVRNKDRYLSVILLQGQQVKGSGVPPIL